MISNIERTVSLMERYDLQALIATASPNVFYLSEYRTPMPTVHSNAMEHQLFAAISREAPENPYLIAPVSDAFALSHKPVSKNVQIHTYGTYYVRILEGAAASLQGQEQKVSQYYVADDHGLTTGYSATAFDAFIEVVNKMGLSKGRIGLDERGVAPELWDRIAGALAGVEFVRAFPIFKEIRMVKTDEEIRRIWESTRIIEKALEDVIREVREGVSEEDLVPVLHESVRNQEATPYLWFIGGGIKSALTDRDPAGYTLKKGDLLLLDMGCSYRSYCSDIARTFVLDQPSKKQISYYDAIFQAEQEAVSRVRPGVAVSNLFDVAVKTARKCGIEFYRRHHCGHGIGLDPYDPPLVAPGTDIRLEKGMVINLETPYYELGFGGLQLEDTLLVTDDGYEYLSSLDRNLRSL